MNHILIAHKVSASFNTSLSLDYHAPSEEKSEEVKDSFYEELEEVFDQFPKYYMKILLGDFNAKLCREGILNQ